MTGRSALLLCLLCWGVLLLLTLPAPAAEETSYGLLQGTVKLEDGTPCTHMSVDITSAKGKQSVKTDDKGSFAGLFAVGQVTLAVPGATQTVTIVAAEMNHAEIVYKPKGVLLALNMPEPLEGTPDVSGSYKLKDDKPVAVQPGKLNDTHYLFSLPANASALSVLATLAGAAIRDTGVFRAQTMDIHRRKRTAHAEHGDLGKKEKCPHPCRG